jgi:hypothetical protein
MTADPWLTETYFTWLTSESFSLASERREYEGVLRELHDIPFYWTMWSDENRAGDALSFRQYEFLNFQHGLEGVDQMWLGNWATATPSVLEVLLGIARRWTYYFGGDVQPYFGHLFRNMEFDRYPGRVLPSAAKERLRNKVDDWLSRQFKPNGHGSPFPVDNMRALDIIDMRKVDIWGQMNAYSAEHFQ